MVGKLTQFILGASIATLPFTGFSQETQQQTTTDSIANKQPIFIMNAPYKEKLAFIIENFISEAEKNKLREYIQQEKYYVSTGFKVQRGEHMYSFQFILGTDENDTYVKTTLTTMNPPYIFGYTDKNMDGTVDDAYQKCLSHENQPLKENYSRVNIVSEEVDVETILAQIQDEKIYQKKYEETIDTILDEGLTVIIRNPRRR